MRKAFSVYLLGILTIILITGMVFALRFDVSANDKSIIQYKTVRIEQGDTLWSIAETHFSKPAGDMNEYIEDIMSCNKLDSDLIQEGNYLCIPVYTKGR